MWGGMLLAGLGSATIGTVTMSLKTVGALSKFSHLMNLQSSPDIEQLIRADFVVLIADAIDTAAITGSGSPTNHSASSIHQELVQ